MGTSEWEHRTMHLAHDDKDGWVVLDGKDTFPDLAKKTKAQLVASVCLLVWRGWQR